jgi:hypothetical protein
MLRRSERNEKNVERRVATQYRKKSTENPIKSAQYSSVFSFPVQHRATQLCAMGVAEEEKRWLQVRRR